jgi:hypothetical protein
MSSSAGLPAPGVEQFKARVPLINLSSRMQALANVVIQQRLEGLK